ALRSDVAVVVVRDAPDRRERRSVVAGPALIEVVQAELQTVGEHAREADADLAVVDRVAVVVALFEEGRALHEALNAREGREERAVFLVVQRIRDTKAPRTGQVADLDRAPIAGVPVGFEERVRDDATDVPDVPQALHHPERNSEIVPAEGGR